MFRASLSVIAMILSASTAGATELADGDVLIPLVGRARGAHGSEWRTDLVVTHVVRRQIAPPMTVSLTLARSGFADETATFVLDPLASVTIEDLLLRTFGIAEGTGMLRLSGGSPFSQIAARARIYNVGSHSGDYGLTVDAIPASELEPVQLLTALRSHAEKRTSVGIANPGSHDLLVFVTVYDEDDGETRGDFSIVVPARSLFRWNDIFGPDGWTQLPAVTLRISSSAPIYAFASVTSNHSGDSDFIGSTRIPADLR